MLTVETLLESVWEGSVTAMHDFPSNETNLRKLINRLRTALEPEVDPASQRFIKNARGRGYYVDTGRAS